MIVCDWRDWPGCIDGEVVEQSAVGVIECERHLLSQKTRRGSTGNVTTRNGGIYCRLGVQFLVRAFDSGVSKPPLYGGVVKVLFSADCRNHRPSRLWPSCT